MSEMDEMRREDLRRDEMSGDSARRRPSRGDVRGDDGAGDVRGDDGADDVPRPGEHGPPGRDDGRTAPTVNPSSRTDQIANPGAAQQTAPPAGAAGRTAETEAAQLLDPKDRDAMTQRWRDIQADFVDQPQKAMQDADALVAGLMQQLAQMFSQERSQLEAQWSRGDEVSTEDLRVSLQRYLAFFERLLSV